MNHALCRFCFVLWTLGFAGMWGTKGADAIGDLPFEIAARLTLIGGLSLGFLVALDALARRGRNG